MPACRNKTCGFTLIEVLLAITLLSIMVTLLFASMQMCAESWQKGEAKISEVSDTAVVFQFFQQHLVNTKPLIDDFTQRDSPGLAFQGKNQELQFISSFPASAKRSGLQIFSVKLVRLDNEQELQVTIKPFYQPAENEQWREEEVTLLRHVKNFNVSYFGSDDMQAEGYWQEDWLNRQTLPRLVKIIIEREDNQFWPEMRFALKATGSNMQGQDEGFDSLNNEIQNGIIIPGPSE